MAPSPRGRRCSRKERPARALWETSARGRRAGKTRVLEPGRTRQVSPGMSLHPRLDSPCCRAVSLPPRPGLFTPCARDQPAAPAPCPRGSWSPGTLLERPGRLRFCAPRGGSRVAGAAGLCRAGGRPGAAPAPRTPPGRGRLAPPPCPAPGSARPGSPVNLGTCSRQPEGPSRPSRQHPHLGPGVAFKQKEKVGWGSRSARPVAAALGRPPRVRCHPRGAARGSGHLPCVPHLTPRSRSLFSFSGSPSPGPALRCL